MALEHWMSEVEKEMREEDARVRITTKRSSMEHRLMRYFAYDHLPESRGVFVSGYGWRYRRRLRPLVVRPRSRELLDRLGLIVGLVYVEDKQRAFDRIYYNGFDGPYEDLDS